MSTYLKPQSPLYNEAKDAYIYPLTTADQVVMPDGSRLDNNNFNGLSMELLWENASPGSTFGAQTVNVNLSGYDRVRVEFIATTTYKYGFITECSVGNVLMTSFIWGDTGTYAQRSASTSTSGISFNKTNKDKTTDNTYCIPYKIYGIKGVIE